MSIKVNASIKAFWDKFIQSSEQFNQLKNLKIDAWSFGNTPSMANDLGKLVIAGKKTATCSLLRAYEGYEDEIPQVGTYSVICDGEEEPLCVIFLTHTWICKYSEVDEKHAYEEGEGDRTLSYWKKAHHEFFSQYPNFTENDLLICERFQVVYKA